MKTGIPEIDEITPRAYRALPALDPQSAQRVHFVVVQFRALLESPMFDALYQGVVVFGDFGLYRVGELQEGLVLTTSPLGLPGLHVVADRLHS